MDIATHSLVLDAEEYKMSSPANPTTIKLRKDIITRTKDSSIGKELVGNKMFKWVNWEDKTVTFDEKTNSPPKSLQLWNSYRTYFHCTTNHKKLISILKSGKINFSDLNIYSGAFVSTRPEFAYGKYCIQLNHNIENVPVLRSACFNDVKACYVGFAKSIPVDSTTFVGISIPEEVRHPKDIKIRTDPNSEYNQILKVVNSLGLNSTYRGASSFWLDSYSGPIESNDIVVRNITKYRETHGVVLPSNWNTDKYLHVENSDGTIKTSPFISFMESTWSGIKNFVSTFGISSAQATELKMEEPEFTERLAAEFNKPHTTLNVGNISDFINPIQTENNDVFNGFLNPAKINSATDLHNIDPVRLYYQEKYEELARIVFEQLRQEKELSKYDGYISGFNTLASIKSVPPLGRKIFGGRRKVDIS